MCINAGESYQIIYEKNSQGLYDVALVAPDFWGYPDEFLRSPKELICLYENLTRDQWKALKKSGELERIFDKADEIVGNWRLGKYDLC